MLSQNCTNALRIPSSCLQDEFQCSDRFTCIHKSWVCDGGADCPQGDDEHLSICRNITCREDQFQCKDLSCIPGHLTCSGTAECPDGSDEFNCSKLKEYRQTAPIIFMRFEFAATQAKVCDRKIEFDCGDGMCIPNLKVCDQHVDCPAGQDEPLGKCNQDECKKNNGGCEHLCFDTPAGFYCDCHKGYVIAM